MVAVNGGLIFITGLSGSGKSTLAQLLLKALDARYGIKAIFLDGDSLRECVGNTDYTREGRERMSMYYVRTASMLVNQGFIVVLATISMFESVRQFNRKHFANYLEIYLDVQKEILQARDSKGFYKENVSNMAVTQDLEVPTQSDLVFYDNFDSNQALEMILSQLKQLCFFDEKTCHSK